MTYISSGYKKCSVCGGRSRQEVVLSFFSIRPPLLDTRLPDRPLSIPQCPSCGYCAFDLSEELPGVEEIVLSSEYQSQLKSPKYPAIANNYICNSMIQQRLGRMSAAIQAMVSATWVCDIETTDNFFYEKEKMEEAAKLCRLKTLELIDLAEEKGESWVTASSRNIAIFIDFLRRAGLFERAKEEIARLKEHVEEEKMRKILDFQRQLVEREDTEPHSVIEVLGEANYF